MNRLFSLPLFSAILTLSTAAGVADPAHIGRRDSTPEDVGAIMQLTKDFHDALVAKNVRQLSTLMFRQNILFASPASAERVKMVNDQKDVNFDGVPAAGFEQFAQFVSGTTGAIEEKLYNVKVVQDGHLAWVSFDFEFIQDGKVMNYGVENWQVLKTSGDKWKILSNVWSSHGAPR